MGFDQHGNGREFILLETPEAKRYAGFTMMVWDLDLMLQAISQLSHGKNPVVIRQSLFFFAVVTYAKSFASNESNRPRLEPADIFRNADVWLKDEHHHIMQLHNGYAAHLAVPAEKIVAFHDRSPDTLIIRQ